MLCDCSNCKYNSCKGYCKDISGIKINNKGMCNWYTEDISKCSKCSPQKVNFDKCKYCQIEYSSDPDPYGHGDYKIICTKNNKVANYLYCTEKCSEGEEVEDND